MKKRLLLICGLAMMLGLTACGGKKETKEETKDKIVVETEVQAEKEARPELPEGQMYSYLTGEPVEEEVGTQRPFAIMINNIDEALPQAGICQADIVYECLVEGNITRMLGLFQNFEGIERIGSVRSARHYYMDLAKDDEAIFTHFGQSIFAEDRINQGYQTISGLSGYSDAVFYRAADRYAPHDVFTTEDGLMAGLDYTGLTREYSENYEGRLNFYNEDTTPEGSDANVITMPFSYASPWFEYDAEAGLYNRYQYGGAHVDDQGEQLKFKNLVIQYAERSVISDEDHQDFALIGEGEGLIITNGKAVKIRWERPTEADRTTYYYEDGSYALLNCGHSYIAVVPTETPVVIE